MHGLVLEELTSRFLSVHCAAPIRTVEEIKNVRKMCTPLSFLQ